MKDVAWLGGTLFGFVTCLLLFSLGVVDHVDGIPGAEKEPALALPTYLSFISVMLTAITAVLAAVAIGIGVIAAYTFREIKDEAREAANKKVNELVEDKLSDSEIQRRINRVAFKQNNARDHESLDELEENFDPEDNGER